jgi:hypothetical protein
MGTRRKAKPEKLSTKLWRAANQPVALLLLSSGVLAGITHLYTERQQQFESAHTRQEDAKALFVEIRLRAEELKGILLENARSENPNDGLARFVKMQKCQQRRIDITFVPGKHYVDLTLSGEQRTEVKAVVYGGKPYSPSDQRFRDVNLMGLVIKLDQLAGDRLSETLVPKERGLQMPGTHDGADVLTSVSAISHMADACFVGVGLNYLRRYLSARGASEALTGTD